MSGTLAQKMEVSPLRSTEESVSKRLVSWCSFPVLAACLLACLVYLWVPATMADPDIWWHLRNAEYQLGAHAFLRHDVYSFTAAGAPWIDHEWLAELPFYAGWRAWGPRGVYLVTLGTVELIMLGVFYLCSKKSGSLAGAMVASAIGVALATVSFGPRTLLFGWLCLVAELVVLEKAGEDGRGLWALPGLFALWVNLHGSWMIGMVLLLVFTACAHTAMPRVRVETLGWPAARLRTLRTCVGASVAALFLNPYGWRLVLYPLDLAFRQRLNTSTIEEWKTLDFHSSRGKLLLLSLGLLFVMQVVKGRRWPLHEVAFLAVGVYASFTYSRFLFLATILVMPLVAKHLPLTGLDGLRRDRPWLNLLLIGAMGSLVVSRLPSKEAMLSSEEPYPYEATSFLQQFRFEGRLFNEYLWGGYLEWTVRQVPVFIDSRVDIFEYNGSFRDYLDIIRLKQPLELLDKYKIRYVLFEQDTPLSYLLMHTVGWKVDYQDGKTILFERAGH